MIVNQKLTPINMLAAEADIVLVYQKRKRESALLINLIWRKDTRARAMITKSSSRMPNSTLI